MAAAKCSRVKTDKEWHAHLLCRLSGMLIESDFKKLKHLFCITGRVPLKDIAKCDDFFDFLVLLERVDQISVGQYDILIQHLEMLDANNCIRVISEHTDEINEYRQAQGQATSQSDQELLNRQMVEDLINRKLQEFRGNENQSLPQTTSVGANDPIPSCSSLPQTTSVGAKDPIPSCSTRKEKPKEPAEAIFPLPQPSALEEKPQKPTQDRARYVAPPSADVNKRDEFGLTPLMRAARSNAIASVRSCIEAGADLDLTDMGRRTALIIASENNHKEVVAELIKAGADVNIIDQAGTTALIHASEYGDNDVVSELIKAGADVNIIDQFGDSALSEAEENGHWEIAQMLKSATTRR